LKKLLLAKKIVRTYLKKRNKPDVSETVIEEAVRAVQERTLFPTVAASRYGNDPYSTALQN